VPIDMRILRRTQHMQCVFEGTHTKTRGVV
jgi:hypothetical protein